ncbi:glycosyltransferase [Aureispira anguillae]|uniref:glycosyltransferase n=1 Tax=Aureispira anguillae TaxID=2864201 RepID=UPI00222E7ACE|nr:glycosyltransferase [Aureispira anguillae]
MKSQKNILIAVLNWGLGHATRCIPIIDEFIKQRANVVLASDGDALLLLQQKYPNLTRIELPAYGIHYKGDNMLLNILPQVPKIINAICLERKKLNSIIQDHQITTIISDNRFGMYHKKIPSIFLTHQLNIQIPYPWLESIVAKFNHYFIRKFDECWVPDVEAEPSLAGLLSHQKKLKNVRYIGVLSRMSIPTQLSLKWDVLVVLSGPEPQRTYLEQKIIAQAKNLPFQFLIVAGRPSVREEREIGKNIFWRSFMNQKELEQAMAQSRVLVTRSGYSTIMDLVAMECHKVLLIPTPGQTEQEYLANRFAEAGTFLCQPQNALNLEKGIGYLMQHEMKQLAKPIAISLKDAILSCLSR